MPNFRWTNNEAPEEQEVLLSFHDRLVVTIGNYDIRTNPLRFLDALCLLSTTR
jgi:hypothetical protein